MMAAQILPSLHQLSNTRWLVKGKCIYSIVTKWEELKTHSRVSENLQSDSCVILSNRHRYKYGRSDVSNRKSNVKLLPY